MLAEKVSNVLIRDFIYVFAFLDLLFAMRDVESI